MVVYGFVDKVAKTGLVEYTMSLCLWSVFVRLSHTGPDGAVAMSSANVI